MLSQESSAPQWWMSVWEPVRDWLADHPTPALFLAPLALIVAWSVTLFVGRRLLLAGVRMIVRRTNTEWDDLLLESQILHRASHLIPIAVAEFVSRELPGLTDGLREWIQRGLQVATIGIIVSCVFAVADGAQVVWARRKDSKRRPIKGYLQLVKLFATIAGLVAIAATLLGSDVGSLVAGIGVSTAVVMLVFKDTILSVVASIQLTANDIVRVGDWIEMPKHGADGDVVDIALHTVKVQNWDKTITSIPTYDLYATAFKNWRGMKEARGRRIKRDLQLDVASIRFLDDSDVERLSRISLLEGYLADKQAELAQVNAGRGELAENQRRMTNLGTFRAYVAHYLREHPALRGDLTMMVRQLQPSERGLPLEIYAFTKTTAWGEYEGIQADIFDHLMAMLPVFDLRAFQFPTGSDVAEFVGGRRD